MDNRYMPKLDIKDLMQVMSGIDPYDQDTTYASIPLENDLENLDEMLIDFNDNGVSDEELQNDLMNAIAERAAVLNQVRSQKIPGGGSDMDYEQRDYNALKQKGYDPNDLISSFLINTDTSNTDYNDPNNVIYNILQRGM